MELRKQKLYKAVLLFIPLAFCYACNNSNRLPDRVTFTEHIAPLFYKHCTVCHRPTGMSHIELVNYNEAKNYASAIAYVVKERLMPPWPADPHYTEFSEQRLLTEHEIKLIEKWAADGAPEGAKDKMPPEPEYPAGSAIGTPDLRLPLQPFFLKANSSDRFLLVKVPFELPRDTYAAVVEFVPGPHNVVHHVNGDMVKYDFDKKKDVFEGQRVSDMVNDTNIIDAFKKLGLPNDDGTYPVLEKSVVNYLPGVYAQRYPGGIGGFFLPRKGAFLLNDMHYGFTRDEDLTDSSYINVFFTKTPPERIVQEFQLGTVGISPVVPDLVIPPNTIKKVHSSYVVPMDISVLTVNPHMHLLGKSFKAYAVKPDGDTIRLISIPRWDFNWQYFYTFKKMVKIPKGSTITAEGVYDNTKNNLLNPYSPPRLVRDNNGSMKATDEMFQFIISYLPYKEGDEQVSLEVPQKPH
ncbi:MAG: hypothetical protein BGO69_09865 [Bacteroidetes bacterium 46-16]|nr:MAG: hypothetical protein BGO69_09865 [Bacteroidetes bacterium 46-16]